MVQQVNSYAVRIGKVDTKGHLAWYKCNRCYDIFSCMLHFESCDFYYCVPRRCPNCGSEFRNGMEPIE
jgi:uncharacterized C2H2 Zn-finger protein